jgi:hypothetical protein
MTEAQRDKKRMRLGFNYPEECGDVSRAWRYCGISRKIFDLRKRTFEQHDGTILMNGKANPEHPKLRTPPEIEETILHLHHNQI